MTILFFKETLGLKFYPYFEPVHIEKSMHSSKCKKIFFQTIIIVIAKNDLVKSLT